MENEVKVTSKMTAILNTVEKLGGSAFAKDVLAELDKSDPQRAELRTINAVNATLAYLAKVNKATKAKEQVGEKMLTKYTLV